MFFALLVACSLPFHSNDPASAHDFVEARGYDLVELRWASHTEFVFIGMRDDLVCRGTGLWQVDAHRRSTSVSARCSPPGRCSDTDLEGCQVWSYLLRRSGEVVAQEQLARRLCDAGQAIYCGVVAELSAVMRRPNALELARAACTNDAANGCYVVGVLSGELDEKRQAIERACGLGHAEACRARQLFEHPSGGAPGRGRASR